MFSPDCATALVGSPLICTEALCELRAVLSAWQASADCGKAFLEHSPREVVRESTDEAAKLTAEPATHQCPQGSPTRRQTKTAGAGARGTTDQRGSEKRPTIDKRRRR